MTPLPRKLAVLNRVFAGHSLSAARQLEGYAGKGKGGYSWLFRGQESEVRRRIAKGELLPERAALAWNNYRSDLTPAQHHAVSIILRKAEADIFNILRHG